MTKKIAVIDGNSLMHRAYHAVPPTMNAPDGTPTNAVFGFFSMLLKFIEVASPDALVCAFDVGKPDFRTKALARYKAQRPPMDNELRVQFPVIEELLESMNIPVIKVPGWEGDDILGTVAARDEALGYETLLVTGDKDAYQLATELTRVVTTKKGITDIAIYGPEEVKERYGIEPEQVPDFLGLKGDSSDNIPGVPGIGEKTAAKLLQQFGSLEGIYENLDKLKGKQLENLRDNKEEAFVSREVATIVTDLDFPLNMEELSFPSFDPKVVEEAFTKIRFHAYMNKILGLVGGQSKQESFNFDADGVVRDEAQSEELLNKAISAKERIGVVVDEKAQASLFEAGLSLSFSSSAGTAIVEGEVAKEFLARIIKEAPWAAFEVKKAIKHVFPADTSQAALVSESELFAMDAYDLGLASYLLDSSASDYKVEDLLVSYGLGMMPELKEESQVLACQASAVRSLIAVIEAALEEDGSASVYKDIDGPLISVLALLERTGVAIDVEGLRELGVSTQAEIESLQAEIYSSAGEEFNIDSPKQLSHILFEVIGLTPKKKTQTGYSTNAAVLKELEAEHDLPGLVLRYRELAKIKSTYIDALPRLRAEDGRIHTTFNETVTTTGRLSSSDPNLQNIPVRTDFGRQIRECFIPLKTGEVFLSADYSQIELRLLAHLSEDEGLIDAFCSGTDFHAQTASRVFDLPIEEITPELRSRAKAVNFGIVYGQQAFGLSQSLGISFAEAKEMIDRYFLAYPKVRSYLDDTIDQAQKHGYAVTMFGRKRHIPELKIGNASQRGFGERTAMNHPMQGSAADIIKLAMVKVQKLLDEGAFSTKMILQVHDELDFSTPHSELEAISSMVKTAMEEVVELKVPLVVDVSWGDTWAEAH